MYLIVALCLLCGWVAPLACRSVDVRDPPSEDLEPFVAHHHHEGNIAELLIPLLERSLAQSEARSNERQHRRSKAGKKVIQVLPYKGSEEHERKGWRKLNSHKKQVVEITPLHGKNRAKPLAYILSAAKPSHTEHAETNDDVSSSNTSELEHDKSTSEEQQSSEENRDNSEDVNVNTLRAGDGDSPSASSNVQSSEDANTKEPKDLSVSERESADATAESDVTAEKFDERQVVVVDESEEDEPLTVKSAKHTHHDHHHESKATVETATVEEDATVEDVGATVEDVGATVEDATTTAEDRDANPEDVSAAVEDKAETVETAATVEAADATVEIKAMTEEDLGATVEDIGLTIEEKAVTVEDVEVTVEDRAATVEDVEVTIEDKAATVEEETATVEEETATTEENATAEDKAAAVENDVATIELAVEDDATVERTATDEVDAKNADVTVEDNATVETTATVEDTETHLRQAHVQTHPHHVDNDVSDINHLIDTISRGATVENEDSSEHDQSGYIENDLVISRGHPESDSAEKSVSKLFNARDIIELIQSSVEASTAAPRNCLEPAEKHHDHKSYRLSFLFNK